MATQSRSVGGQVVSHLIILAMMVFGFLASTQEGSVQWMGFFWILQAATCWLALGATPRAHTGLLSYRVYTKVCSLLVTRKRVFFTLSFIWIMLLFVYYYISTYSRLDFGAVGLLSSGFILSTYILYAGRHIVTKSDIKALMAHPVVPG
jgi:hypothetical protein